MKYVDIGLLIFLYYHFNVSEICSDVTSFIYDISNLCLPCFLIISLAKRHTNFTDLYKGPAYDFVILSVDLLISALILIIYFLLQTLNIVYFSFSSFLR